MKKAPFRLQDTRTAVLSLLVPILWIGDLEAQQAAPLLATQQVADTDSDRLPDEWELKHFGNLSSDPSGDPDGDTLDNLLEANAGTDPSRADSDGDGRQDWIGLPGYLYQEKWPEPTEPNPRDFYPRDLFNAPGATVFFHPGAAVLGNNEKFFRQRLRGLLRVPASGQYELYISGNSWCELWLGENESRFSARRVAGMGTDWNMGARRNQFEKFPSQKSALLNLEAGRDYYIEILHRTLDSPRHQVTLAWKPPGGEKPVVVPPSALRSWIPDRADADDDGIADEWKRRSGLVAGRESAMADADGDGISNCFAYALGCNPKAGDSLPGALSWSRWFNPPKCNDSQFDVSCFAKSPAGDRKPDFRHASALAAMKLPTGRGQLLPTIDRLYGTVTAPEAGLYTFWVIGQAGAELSLSTDVHSFGKTAIVRRTRNTAPVTSWDKSPAAGSVPIWLEKGESRFIEALYAPPFGNSSLSVNWKMHSPPRWSESALGGGTAGTWSDRNPATMVATVSGPASFGGAAGDGLSFRHVTTTGACEAVCRLDSVRALSPSAGGGLMFRASLDSFAPFVAVTLDGDRKFGLHSRAKSGGDESSSLTRPYQDAGFRLEDAVWLKLVTRSGMISALFSTDGITWKTVGDIKVNLGDKIVAGPAAWGGHVKEPVEVIFSNLAVGAVSPDTEIPASALASAGIDPADLDADGLPDAWEREQGLDPAVAYGADGPQGDPDKDGFVNLAEYRLGGSALEAGGFPGKLKREVWRVFGSTIAELTADPRFKLAPDLTDLVSQPDLEGGDGSQHYGQRLRGTVTAPTSGTYRFWIAGDNGCSLSLSTDASRTRLREIAALGGSGGQSSGLHDWDRFPSQRSIEINLEGGSEYFIEILHKEGRGADHVAVAWEYTGSDGSRQSREILPSRVLKSHVPNKDDLDDDSLPDEWETRYGLNPNDNGRHDPVREGGDGDFDSDGLTNMVEYRLGTIPSQADTDGDGVSDYDEIHVYGSDPLLKDVHPPVENHRFNLVNGTPQGGGTWVSDASGALASGYRRGKLMFEFDVDAPGIYALALEANSVGTLASIPSVPVTVSINSALVGQTEFPARAVTRKWLTPWLPVGRHTVLVENRNVRANINLRILSLTLSRFEDADSLTGVPAWLSKLLVSRNHALQDSKVSNVSPWFVEGFCRYPKSVSITADGVSVQVLDNLVGRWHADIPLPPDGSAGGVDINFENGVITSKHKVSWVPTNLAEAPPVNHLRVGDSIRVTAQEKPNDTFNLEMNDRQWLKQSASEPVTLTFDEPGTYELNATVNGREKITTTYHVHRAHFGAPPSLVAGSSRVWKPEDIHQPLEVQADPRLHLTPLASADDKITSLMFRLGLDSNVAGPLPMVARLPGEGPIIATGTVNALRLASGSKTGDANVIGTLADGTRVVEVSYIMEGVIPADLSIWIRLYVTDAVFASGLTWMRLTAADFDENGVARFRVLKAPGTGTPYVCHWILPYADFEDVLKLRPTE